MKEHKEYDILSIFPCSIYVTCRDSNKIDSTETEEKGIEEIIAGGMHKNISNSSSNNTNILLSNKKLKNLKEYCEKHINTYVKQVINPKEELDFYITQSWLSITRPGESHHSHFHANSIISGVYYIATTEDDQILFSDPNLKIKQRIQIESEEASQYNCNEINIGITNFVLLLFPSWLDHSVPILQSRSPDRISISFNTFAKGIFGTEDKLNKLVL